MSDPIALFGHEMMADLGKRMRANSERWFPQFHADPPVPADVFYALGLAGEAGEVANVIKKSLRGTDVDPGALADELADVFTYLMLLADECDINMMAAYEHKRDICEGRWGAPVVETDPEPAIDPLGPKQVSPEMGAWLDAHEPGRRPPAGLRRGRPVSQIVKRRKPAPLRSEPRCPLCRRPRSDEFSACSHAFHSPVVETKPAEPDPESVPTTCHLCGRPAQGWAFINDKRYCHGDYESQTCYEQAAAKVPGGDPFQPKRNTGRVVLRDEESGKEVTWIVQRGEHSKAEYGPGAVEPGHLADDMIEPLIEEGRPAATGRPSGPNQEPSVHVTLPAPPVCKTCGGRGITDLIEINGKVGGWICDDCGGSGRTDRPAS